MSIKTIELRDLLKKAKKEKIPFTIKVGDTLFEIPKIESMKRIKMDDNEKDVLVLKSGNLTILLNLNLRDISIHGNIL